MLFEARPTCIDSSISSIILLWLQSHSIFASKHTFFPGNMLFTAIVVLGGPLHFWPPAKLNSGHLEIFAAGRPGRPDTRGRFCQGRIIKNKGFLLILQYYCYLEVQIRPVLGTDYFVTNCSSFDYAQIDPHYFRVQSDIGPKRSD